MIHRQEQTDYEPEFVFIDYGATYEIKHVDRNVLFDVLKGLARGWDSRTQQERDAGVAHKVNLACVWLWTKFAEAM